MRLCYEIIVFAVQICRNHLVETSTEFHIWRNHEALKILFQGVKPRCVTTCLVRQFSTV